MISFVSMEFLAFVGVTLLLYFWVPARYRWLVLLGSSIYFYFCSGAVQLLVVLGSTGIAYGTALRVEKIHTLFPYTTLFRSTGRKRENI